MSCAAYEDELSLLVSDDLPEDRARDLQRHVAHCAACHARLDEFRADALWLRQQRNAAPDPLAIDQLQARIAGQIAHRPPASWTVAWLRRLAEAATRGPQPLLTGLAVALLLVGTVGALMRPLDRRREAGSLGTAELVAPTHRHRDPDREELGLESEIDDEAQPGGEVAGTQGSDEPVEPEVAVGGNPVAGAADESTDLAAPTPGSMRIEMKTGDPDVRIIWFAQAGHDENRGPGQQ